MIDDDGQSNWKLAKESNDDTQWMNHATVFASLIFFGNTSEEMVNILHHNMKQGIPQQFLRK